MVSRGVAKLLFYFRRVIQVKKSLLRNTGLSTRKKSLKQPSLFWRFPKTVSNSWYTECICREYNKNVGYYQLLGYDMATLHWRTLPLSQWFSTFFGWRHIFWQFIFLWHIDMTKCLNVCVLKWQICVIFYKMKSSDCLATHFDVTRDTLFENHWSKLWLKEGE